MSDPEQPPGAEEAYVTAQRGVTAASLEGRVSLLITPNAPPNPVQSPDITLTRK